MGEDFPRQIRIPNDPPQAMRENQHRYINSQQIITENFQAAQSEWMPGMKEQCWPTYDAQTHVLWAHYVRVEE